MLEPIAHDKVKRLIGLLGVLSAMIVLGLSLVLAFFFPPQRQPVHASHSSVIELKAKVSNIEGRINELGGKIEGLSRLSDESKTSAQLSSVQGSLDGLQERFTKIEGLLAQDPLKALEIPLLRKDLEFIEESTQLTISGLRQDLDRTYTLLVGTMMALVITVLASAVSSLFAKKQQPEK